MDINIDQLQESERRFVFLKDAPPVRRQAESLPEEAFITNIEPEMISGNLLSNEANLEK